jgi:hypothetical protein
MDDKFTASLQFEDAQANITQILDDRRKQVVASIPAAPQHGRQGPGHRRDPDQRIPEDMLRNTGIYIKKVL